MFSNVSLRFVVRNDEELNALIKATIAGGGVLPHIHSTLLKKNNKNNEAPVL